jgi:hypothetical protein
MRRTTMESLRVVAVDNSIVQHDAFFDEYVPLRIRSYSQPLGAGVVRLGDYSRTLLELMIEPHSQRLRGATLTSLDRLDAWPAVSLGQSQSGTPILGTTFSDRRIDDLSLDFRVAIADEGILIFWEGLQDCDVCDCGRIQFLVAGGVLAGIWCTQLTTKERELFLIAAGV